MVSCGQSLPTLGHGRLRAVPLPTRLRNRPAAIPPRQVAKDGLLLLLVSAKIRMVQSKLLQGGELALDAIQPGGVGGSAVEPHVVSGGPLEHFGLQVGFVVVQDDVQPLAARVTPPHPFQEREKLPPRLPSSEDAPQAIRLQVFVRRQRTPASRSRTRNQATRMSATIFCSIKYCRSLASDHGFMPMRMRGGERATAAIGSRTSAKNFRGPVRAWKDDSRVTAIDLVSQLSFHTMQLLPFVRTELPCSD